MNRRYGNRAFVNSRCGSYSKNVQYVCFRDDTETFTSEFHLICFIIIEKNRCIKNFLDSDVDTDDSYIKKTSFIRTSGQSLRFFPIFKTHQRNARKSIVEHSQTHTHFYKRSN